MKGSRKKYRWANMREENKIWTIRKVHWITWEWCHAPRRVIHDSPELLSYTLTLPLAVTLALFSSSYQRDIQNSTPWSRWGLQQAYRHRWLKWHQKAVIISAGHPLTLTRPWMVATLTLHVSISVSFSFWAKRRLPGLNLQLHLEAKDRKITDEGNPLISIHSFPVKEVLSNAASLEGFGNHRFIYVTDLFFFFLFQSKGEKTGYAVNFAAGGLPSGSAFDRRVGRRSSGKTLLWTLSCTCKPTL